MLDITKNVSSIFMENWLSRTCLYKGMWLYKPMVRYCIALVTIWRTGRRKYFKYFTLKYVVPPQVIVALEIITNGYDIVT